MQISPQTEFWSMLVRVRGEVLCDGLNLMPHLTHLYSLLNHFLQPIRDPGFKKTHLSIVISI